MSRPGFSLLYTNHETLFYRVVVDYRFKMKSLPAFGINAMVPYFLFVGNEWFVRNIVNGSRLDFREICSSLPLLMGSDALSTSGYFMKASTSASFE